ncbi:MAG: M67 family metallopeptidase [Candidatus Omnitrophica bacterium]|nr:M67 family metallopeptidase [Candidatus Omnitrophota bacterium]
MIVLTQEQKTAIEREARQHYPNECCGILAGHIQGRDKCIQDIYPVSNINQERSVDRYNIDPKEFLAVSKRIESLGQSLVGIYHSHPDHPDRPSEFDRGHAWEVYSYIIVGIEQGKKVSMRSFALDPNRQFQEEEIKIVKP